MGEARQVRQRLRDLRAADPPTHGGRVLSYVYDSGRPDLDAIATEAAALFQPVNGLDPTTFTSVAQLERDLVRFGRDILHGDADVVGSVTSGGTESCLLAVKAARDRSPRSDGCLVLPTTAHPAFRKAAAYLRLRTVEVPVTSAGAVDATTYLAAIDGADDVVLAVLSAPSYPAGALDPIEPIAAGCCERGVDLHVDACLGGFTLPWWRAALPPWDFRVPGVTSMSADLHKYGFAPKGVSLVLYRGRERHLAQYFASAAWPGYPVVNPTVLGSRSAMSMAAAWAVVETLGEVGFAQLVAATASATARLRTAIDAVDGLRVLGDPVGGVLAMVADGERPVDPFLFIDEVATRGFRLQAQPAFTQPDGTVVPRSAHVTVTPVTADIVEELVAAIVAAADAARGRPAPTPDPSLIESVAAQGLPTQIAGVMATLEALPTDVAPGLLAQLLAAVIDPDRAR